MLRIMMYCYFIFSILLPSLLFSWNANPSQSQISNPKEKYCLLNLETMQDTTPSPVEIFGAKRVIDEQGNESYERVDDDFFIYPATIVLQPKQRQVVRVVWKGDLKTLKEEKAYRIILKEIPVETTIETTQVTENIGVGVKFSKSFVTSLYVTPKNAKPKISVECKNIATVEQEDGTMQQELLLTLRNQGNAHLTFNAFNLDLVANHKKQTIDHTWIMDHLGVVVLLPHHTREVKIPLPNDFPDSFPIDNAQAKISTIKKLGI